MLFTSRSILSVVAAKASDLSAALLSKHITSNGAPAVPFDFGALSAPGCSESIRT